ncbi:hypothetical protein [Acidianus brierleyi]|uniref:Uncharacterized protein n=1 Tax=Acidianus brierleyi TaxID=41673 RepID=A0A2U9ICM9_9CREN|nr:hypothetical protein [Acidianus brierleyi]AWR93767.1 hypothetical protein DFR85_03190 [Acidianus brierleyi]
MYGRIKKILEKNSLKILTIFTIIIVTLTSILSILYLFTPILIGYQKTSNGIIDYFKNIIDPSFIIKAYSNNTPVNAIISVYINQPHKVKFYKEFYGESLKIPFTSIENYVKPWEKYENENTSLLVIATYIKGNETFTSTEEIQYNPNWVLKNQPIQIVANVNIIPQLIKLNNTMIQQENNKIQTLKTSYYKYCYCGGEKYPYIVNMSKEEYEEPPTYPVVVDGAPVVYEPVTSVLYFYNFSVPLNWITLSNNVKNNDNYTYISLDTSLFGKVSWYAVSNSTNYGGPYIGVSYSANVNWQASTYYNKPFLSNLYNPTIYNYYNATIAVVIYTIYKVGVHGIRIPIDNVTVFEILWASPNVSGAVESSNGLTCVIYTNSSGEYTHYLSIGNGSVTLFYNYFKEFIGNQKSGQYGYAQWGDGKITSTGNIKTAGNSFYFFVSYINEYIKNNNQTENYFTNTIVSVYIPVNTMNQICGSGHVYVSYLNYSTALQAPLLGFIMNYSSYYGG